MIEIGNGVFMAEQSSQGLAMSRTHMTYWCIMKAILLLGNDFTEMSKETHGVIANPDAISVNQDALGIAGRRVASMPPSNLTLVDSGDDTLAVLAKCVPGKKAQSWTFQAHHQKAEPTLLAIAPCNHSDSLQHWNFSVGADLNQVWTPLQSLGTGQCIDDTRSNDPLQTATCTPHAAGQAYTLLEATTGQMTAAGHGRGCRCLDVYQHRGPDVELGGCKTEDMSNQQWTPTGPSKTMLQTRSTVFPPGNPMCLTLTKGSAGGTLAAVDGNGRQWLLAGVDGLKTSNVVLAGSTRAKSLNPSSMIWQVLPDPHSGGAAAAVARGGRLTRNVTINGYAARGSGSLSFQNNFGASGRECDCPTSHHPLLPVLFHSFFRPLQKPS